MKNAARHLITAGLVCFLALLALGSSDSDSGSGSSTKQEAEADQDPSEKIYIDDSPMMVMGNTQSFDTNLTSMQVENNEKYYNGKYIRNWRLGVSDVSESRITTYVPCGEYGDCGSHGIFVIEKKSIKGYGSIPYEFAKLRTRQSLPIRSARLKKGLVRFYLVDVEFK